MRIPQLIVVSVAAVVLIGAGTRFLLHQSTKLSSRQNTAGSMLVSKAALDKLPIKEGSFADTSHLSSSIVPPTNSWLSGMVLQKTPLPVFPMPLSFLAKDTGFEIGSPITNSTATTISGGHVSGITASISQASSFQLTRYDKISATLTYKDTRQSDIGRLTLAEGVPYVYFHASRDTTMTLHDVASISNESSKTYIRYEKAGRSYIAVANSGATMTPHEATVDIDLKKDSLLTFYSLSDKGADTLHPYAGNELTGASTSHHQSDQTTVTSIQYRTATNKPTAYAPMGYEQSTSAQQSLVDYDTIYGTMHVVFGNELSITAPSATISNRLDLSKVSAEHKQRLLETLKSDVATTKISAQDSYYAGKQLARAANLLDIAMQLNDKASASTLSDILKSAMESRLNGKYFYYDSKIKGIAATTKAFGSEDFNDHHFHYGYFIYAASILGKFDKQFLSTYKDDVNLIVADIASDGQSDKFPVQRNYDAYAGHSWAAGLAPFADGNNQESSSEAMNAWNAVALWGELTQNSQLATDGKWMLSNESEAAQKIWRSTPSNISGISNFSSPLTSLNFNGKRTYSTFFSDDANAKLGIQLIPMNPAMSQLPDNAISNTHLVEQSIKNDNFNVALGDYILMYVSLHAPERAATLATKQQDAYVDDGNSRTYFNAFIFNQTDK